MENSHPSTADHARLVAGISDKLHQVANARSHGVLWLAVDAPATNSEPLPHALQAEVDGPQVHFVHLGHREIDPMWRPRWVPLDTTCTRGSFALQDSINRALTELHPSCLREGLGRRIAGWLVLRDDVSQAVLHWGRQMLQRRPNGRLSLLRLHDPAVLWTLWALLTPKQQASLLGPVDSWWLLDPSGELTVLESSGEGGDPAPWGPQQWRDIDLIGPINSALRESSGSRLGDLSAGRARDTAMSALRRALACGFDDPQDLTSYALHSITVHPLFDQHPLVKRALDVRQPGDRYGALIEVLGPGDWSAVRNDIAPC